MKLLKNPCFIMFKLGFVVSLILIVAEKMCFISLEYEIALLTNIIFAVCFGFLLYLVAYNVKRNNLIYINRYDFSYIRKLNNYELNRLFRIKIYVAKDDSNKYLAEVYRK